MTEKAITFSPSAHRIKKNRGYPMERFHSEQVRKIWQRVQSGAAYMPEPASSFETYTGIPELIAREQAEQMMLMQLSGRFSGKNREILRQMAKNAQSHTAILRGICAITEGSLPRLQGPKPKNAPTAVLLRRCYGYCLQSLSEYTRRENDPQYGPAFQHIAEQKKNQCRILLSLLGTLK